MCAGCLCPLRQPLREQQLRNCLEKGVQSLGACGCPRAGQELGQNQLKSLDTAQCFGWLVSLNDHMGDIQLPS